MTQMHRPNPHDPPPGRTAGTEFIDPSERLKQLQIELAQQEAKLGHIGKQRDELKADIDDLAKTVDEVKTTLSEYGSEVKDLETKLHGLQYFYDQKHKMVMAAIGDKKDPIDDRIREFDHETERMGERLEELQEMRDAARDESERADTFQREKQADYDAVKEYKTGTENRLTEMDALRTAITQADEKNDVASMYFLVLEFSWVLEHTRILSQHHLAHDLKEELGELEAAKEDARSKKAAWDNLKTEYDAHKATLDARVASRRQHLLDAVQAMCPVQSPPAK
jgi:chaperonin cofactor prefoldin